MPLIIDYSRQGAGGVSAVPTKYYDTLAEMLLDGPNLLAGNNAIVTKDPIPANNGTYTAKIDAPILVDDFFKPPIPKTKVNTFVTGEAYPKETILIDGDHEYIVLNDYTATNIKADLLSGDIVPVGGEHYRGEYPTISALKTAVPIGDNGDYAYVSISGKPTVILRWLSKDGTTYEWLEQSASGLRGNPTKNSAELTSLPARDYELRQILADPNVAGSIDEEYVFKLGATSGAYADDAATGFWLHIEDKLRAYRYTTIQRNETSIVTPFILKNILVFRDGILSMFDTYEILPNRMGIATLGENRNTKIAIVEVSGSSGLKSRNFVTPHANTKTTYDCGEDLGLHPLVFIQGELIDDNAYDISTPSTIEFKTAPNGNSKILITY